MTVALSNLTPGTRLRVTGYAAVNQYTDQLRRLGLVPGTEVTVRRRAPLGDPIEVYLRGYSLALRPSEATDLQFEVMAT